MTLQRSLSDSRNVTPYLRWWSSIQCALVQQMRNLRNRMRESFPISSALWEPWVGNCPGPPGRLELISPELLTALQLKQAELQRVPHGVRVQKGAV
jgi:hypothetical protein